MEILEAIKWALEHGVPGVLAVSCAGMVWVIHKQWLQIIDLNKNRIDDMKMFIDVSDRLHDKIHKTANDLARVVEVLRRRPK